MFKSALLQCTGRASPFFSSVQAALQGRDASVPLTLGERGSHFRMCICLFIVAVDAVTQTGFQLAILLPQLPEGRDDNAPSPVF